MSRRFWWGVTLRETVGYSLTPIGIAGLLLLSSSPARADDMGDSATASPGVAAPYCPDQTQQGLNRCAGIWFSTADHMEDLVYGELQQQLDVQQRIQLAEAEAYWEAFRQAQCILIADHFTGGSIQPLVFAGCMADLTNSRIGDLQGWGETQLTDRQATAQLAALVSDLNLTNTDTQRYWEAYRDSHCTFERISLDGNTSDTSACLLRLTAHRIEQLEEYQAWFDN